MIKNSLEMLDHVFFFEKAAMFFGEWLKIMKKRLKHTRCLRK